MSSKIKTDFTGTKDLKLEKLHSSKDIIALVETMAWIRNNLCVATLTDENDAMMTLMGAEEVKNSLIGIIKKFNKKNEPKLRESLSGNSLNGSKTELLSQLSSRGEIPATIT